MNSRRLAFVCARSAVFLVAGLVVFTLLGWSVYGAVAVGLLAAAVLVQLGGVLWLRRSEGKPPFAPRRAEGAE
ncbi:hypothetical protein [Actinopolyspora mortivallis]|uniref:DUF4229 domain-containing protein n=1 Tax=Actinopolyspora mortivallis TaxID=33906 RepID=A0A2T0GY34_ACTMO|nr:hypothetical protein [Actinopolyspora mortivallis]PRW64018.1 hypothetical protein CEP50_07435 [Actinopolyspora mortivallis]